jgi:hypothetical protein
MMCIYGKRHFQSQELRRALEKLISLRDVHVAFATALSSYLDYTYKHHNYGLLLFHGFYCEEHMT